ncbi:MAG: TolC family protein [Longimicrobiales bacterium]
MTGLTLTLTLTLTHPRIVSGQEVVSVTLGQALEAAATAHPAVAAADASARALQVAARAGDAYLWPRLEATLGGVRTSDPVAAFGTRLRQGTIRAEDLDPARLVDPGAVADWTGGLGIEWRPLDLGAAHAATAADRSADAALARASWTRNEIRYETRVAYLQAQAAEAEVTATYAHVRAAAATLEAVRSRVGEGVASDADLLQARAELDAAEAGRVRAEAARAERWDRLAVWMGLPPSVVPVPADPLPEPLRSEAAQGHDAELPTSRPDLEAWNAEVAAAGARTRAAEGARLPALGGAARWTGHGEAPWDRAGASWSVGVELRVPIFAGGSLGAGEAAARAAEDAARFRRDARIRSARADLAAVARRVASSAEVARAAAAATRAADEAVALLRLRYEEGLTTTAELLASESRAASLRADAVRATLDHHVAAARLALLTDEGIGS